MDLQNLRAFLLVADEGSFSLAAERLHLTQPAVSKRIALLEQGLGSALFDRIGRHTTLTEAGHALLPHARAVAQQVLSAERAVRDLSGDVAGQLRLATSHHIGLHRLAPVLSAFCKAHPGAHIDIEFTDSEQAYDLIRQGRSELAVVTLAPETDDSVIAHAIWHDPLAFMVAPDHPLAAQPRSSALADLARHPAILPGLNTYTGQIIKRLFTEHRLELKVSMATNYLETIRMMTAVGLGWTVLPATMLSRELCVLPLKGITLQRTLGLVYHRGRSLSRAAQAFRAVLETCADPETTPGGR